MKRIITGIFAIALSIGAVQAQKDTTSKKQGRHHKEHKMDAIKKLNLTEEQKVKMRSLNADFKKQQDELKKQEATLTVTQMKERRKALAQEHRSQVESILTKEQKQQIMQAKKEGKEKGKYKNKKGHREEAQKIQQELNLTADQKAKIKTLREDYQIKAEAIRKDNTLDKGAQKKALKELDDKNKEQVKSVLTKEQIEKMEAARGKRPQRSK